MTSRIEIIDRFSDPRWRLSNLYTCVNEDGLNISFIPNSAQLRHLDPHFEVKTKLVWQADIEMGKCQNECLP